MVHTTSELKTAAERLLGLEIAAGRRAATKLSGAEGVSDRLRHVLSTLLGAAGFRALLARAVTLAKAEAPELKAVSVTADGSLDGLSAIGADEHERGFTDGEVILVAQILGLLVTFIGEALMLRLVTTAWPAVKLDDLDFDKGTNP